MGQRARTSGLQPWMSVCLAQTDHTLSSTQSLHNLIGEQSVNQLRTGHTHFFGLGTQPLAVVGKEALCIRWQVIAYRLTLALFLGPSSLSDLTKNTLFMGKNINFSP